MIELILHHKELTRRDLYGWMFRSLFTGPVLGSLPGVLWGLFVFGPVEGSSTLSMALGALIDATIGVLASQALGWATVRAPLMQFASVLLMAVIIAFSAISLGATFKLFSEWIKIGSVLFWIVGLNLFGRRYRIQKGLNNTEMATTEIEGPIERLHNE